MAEDDEEEETAELILRISFQNVAEDHVDDEEEELTHTTTHTKELSKCLKLSRLKRLECFKKSNEQTNPP